MFDFLSDLFSKISNKELATFILAMLPLGELRLSIPIAISVYHLDPATAYFWSVLGNILPIIFVLRWLEPVSKHLSARWSLADKFFKWLFKRTRDHHSRRFEIFGALALITFVAIPLPITGAWTGAVAAFVFGVPFRKALPLIFLGILIAGGIVLFLTLGAGSIF